jgi:hypothetical protein
VVVAPGFSALRLLGSPYCFTQDELLTSGKFAEQADASGIKVDDAMLQALHERRHLLPLFRIDDDAVVGRRISTPHTEGFRGGTRGWVFDAANDGRLRDPAVEGYSAAWPYQRPDDVDPYEWWNGFVYSSWQVLDLHELRGVIQNADRRYLRDRTMRSTVEVELAWSPRPAIVRRWRTVALIALANRYLPSITGHASLPGGEDWARWNEARFATTPGEILADIAIAPGTLAQLGEDLLMSAHWHDPLKDWVPLLRHANATAWNRLHGSALLAMKQRIAAEVLLRGYDELAAEGSVEPLLDLSGSRVSHPLVDRLNQRAERAEPLETVLSQFGLSPHPRVLLLVEGPSELLHVTRLLAELISGDESLVRVQPLGGDTVNPVLLARYVVSPRLGESHDDGWMVSGALTALFITADPGGRWGTDGKRTREIQAIRNEIRADVKRQGGTIDDATMDLLVHLVTWDAPCYELANFNDDELLEPLRALGRQNNAPGTGTPHWEQTVENDLARAHNEGLPLNAVLRHARANKMQLAEELWPVLAAKLHNEQDSEFTTPILAAVQAAITTAQRVPRGIVMLPRSPRPPAPPEDD